ncbi:hypothetical protein [Cyanobium sp. Morenito 9A2]|uniref:hypothetical protein n=1 Tax=Cyanobium sp. Morenito 9A2 TaxID=2823718 RepID=UPI0020CDDBCB|nr:hypothetical protein [Cyanobium sp. Morenito 9A2]MCP9850386.1 hypothetical protein [Cyanobium sp. Morenito 9A2]
MSAGRRPSAAHGSCKATPSSIDQAFRTIDDCLRKEVGCGTEPNETEQTWGGWRR